MKKFEIRISHPQATETKYFTVILPDYFTGEAVYSILRQSKKKKYNLFVKEVNLSWDAGIQCLTMESLMESISQVRLWWRTEKKLYGDPKETILETSEFQLPQHMYIKDVSWNARYGYSEEGITFFRVYLQWPDAVDVSFSCSVNIVKDIPTKWSRNGYCYISGRWKFVQDEKDPSLWKAIKYEVRKDIIGKEVSFIML